MIRFICNGFVYASLILGIIVSAMVLLGIVEPLLLRDPRRVWNATVFLVLFSFLMIVVQHWLRITRRNRWRRYGFSTPPEVEKRDATAEALGAAGFIAFFWPTVISIMWPSFARVPPYYSLLILLPFMIASMIFRRRGAALSKEFEELLKQRHRPCMVCAYDLTPGNLERCPECGTPRENPRWG